MSNKIYLIAGLGNPGAKYEQTRHNIGFMVINELSERYSVPMNKEKFDTHYGKGKMEGHDVILAKPMAFMNRSGPPVRKLADYFDIESIDLVIIHDELDLAFDRLKIKEKGGHGGHNGIRSLVDAFGNGEFPRVRAGIGRPEHGGDVTGHVLGKFHGVDAAILPDFLERTSDAVASIIKDGVKAAMNKYNRLNA